MLRKTASAPTAATYSRGVVPDISAVQAIVVVVVKYGLERKGLELAHV